MTAGSIAVPTVIPLRPPIPGRPKNSVDSVTKIELKTETPDTDIYYTINGWKPEPFLRSGEKFTMKYLGPFTLPAGKQTVKALATSRDGMRQSNIVTKIFEVQDVPSAAPSPQDDHLEFQQDLLRSRAKKELERAKAKIVASPHSAFSGVGDWEKTHRLNDTDTTTTRKLRTFESSQSLEEQLDSQRSKHALFSSRPPPYIFSGIGSQDLRWATHNQFLPHNAPTTAKQQQSKYPQPSDFLNFTTTSAGHYPGGTQWLPVNLTQAGYVIPSPLGMASVGDGTLKSRRVTQDVGTQTVGLFYPSQKQIEGLKEQYDQKLSLEKQMRDRQPLLTAVSPGRGYWRKQIDHICQHLKVHTQNNAEFRALIGEPRMGKLLSSAVTDDGYELSLTLNFALRGSQTLTRGKQLGVSELGQTTLSETGDSIFSEDEVTEEETDEEVVTRSATKKKSRTPKMRTKKKTGPKLSPINSKLFRLLGSKKEISVDEIQQFLDEGADPNCVNQAGVSLLSLAVKNGHVDAIDVLVRGGADINAKGSASLRGNTVLHQAVSQGPSSLNVIDALLLAGADQSIKNDKGETAHDLAIKAGYESISKRLFSAFGQSQLDKMTTSI